MVYFKKHFEHLCLVFFKTYFMLFTLCVLFHLIAVAEHLIVVSTSILLLYRRVFDCCIDEYLISASKSI